ncbi:MAG TPA: hypothetical protein VJ247_09245 [Gaiella sp.]|jgi:hypothetical protein|nr:hypothetical protein [Gaiella sp.]
MRLVAFALLTCAAFAVGVPFLDRTGVAVLGLAFAALTLPRAPLSPWRRSRLERAEHDASTNGLWPAVETIDTDELAERLEAGGLSELAERIERYTRPA